MQNSLIRNICEDNGVAVAVVAVHLLPSSRLQRIQRAVERTRAGRMRRGWNFFERELRVELDGRHGTAGGTLGWSRCG